MLDTVLGAGDTELNKRDQTPTLASLHSCGCRVEGLLWAGTQTKNSMLEGDKYDK